MTDTEFRQQYRFVKQVAGQGGRTYAALDTAGRSVLVHYLERASAEGQRLLALLDATPDAMRQVLQRVEVDGAPVVVTATIPDFQSFNAWIQGFRKAETSVPQSGGEMTQLFGMKAPLSTAPPPAPKPTPPAPPPTTAQESGEETLVMARADKKPPEIVPPPPAPPVKPPDNKPNIRWREAPTAIPLADRPVVRLKKDTTPTPPPPRPPSPPPAPAPAPVAPRPAAPKPMGEMTQMFGPGASSSTPLARDPVSAHDVSGAPSPPPATPPPAPAPSPPPRKEPGEFTRLFHPEQVREASTPPRPEPPPRDLLRDLNVPASVPAPPPPAPAAPPSGAGEFTRMMASVSPPAAPPSAHNPPVASGAPAAAAPGPSEFTRVIKGLGPAAAAPTPVKPAVSREPVTEDDAGRSRRLVVLVVGLAVLALFGIGLVLFFVLRAP